MPNEGSYREAVKLYKDWYGNTNRTDNLILNIPKFPKTWVLLGLSKQIQYFSDRLGSWQAYKHDFENGFEPLIYADPYRRMVLLYGNLDITKDGIVSVKDFPPLVNRD